ncbi:PREDICTED: cystatin-like [Nanorana parkeri]|uniref:cystatin-like n=1 Tax=Nanorana parkeri TaxID=125878 RepID=UPI00085444EA|nr:PREDICTED: cystatin-like [Nanorana parkeri]
MILKRDWAPLNIIGIFTLSVVTLQKRVTNYSGVKIVTGVKYIIEVDIGRTECRKPTANPEDCAFHTDPYVSKKDGTRIPVRACLWFMTNPQLIPSVMAKLLYLAVASVLLAVCFGSRLLGAPRQLSEDDKNVKDALVFAMYNFNKASNDMFASRPVKVLNATVQLVSGLKYDMFVEVGRTACRKPTADVNACAFHVEPSLAKTKICHFIVLNRSWASEINLEKSECE